MIVHAPARRITVREIFTTTHGHAFIVMFLLAIGFSVMPLLNATLKPDNNKDYSRWWTAASAVRQNEALYPPNVTEFGGFIYPPGIAVVFYTPISVFGRHVMVAALCLLTFAGHVFSVYASVYYATGRWRDQYWAVYAAPVLVTIPFVWDIYFLGQFNLTMLGLMLAGFLCIDLAKHGVAGALFAFAASVKAFPILVLGYLFWRRHWVTLVSTIVSVAFLLVVIPACFRGVDRHLQESWTWLDRMVLATSGENLANQPERAYRSGNQSLVSVVHRLTRPTERNDELSHEPANFNANVVDLGPRGSFLLFAGIAGTLSLAYVVALPRRANRTRQTNGIEYSILLLLIVMFSPKAGTYYYCWTIPALAVITAEVFRYPITSIRRHVLGVGLIIAICVLSTALTQAFHIPGPQTYGATLWGSMILLIMLLWLLWDVGRTHGLSQANVVHAATARP